MAEPTKPSAILSSFLAQCPASSHRIQQFNELLNEIPSIIQKSYSVLSPAAGANELVHVELRDIAYRYDESIPSTPLDLIEYLNSKRNYVYNIDADVYLQVMDSNTMTLKYCECLHRQIIFQLPMMVGSSRCNVRCNTMDYHEIDGYYVVEGQERILTHVQRDVGLPHFSEKNGKRSVEMRSYWKNSVRMDLTETGVVCFIPVFSKCPLPLTLLLTALGVPDVASLFSVKDRRRIGMMSDTVLSMDSALTALHVLLGHAIQSSDAVFDMHEYAKATPMDAKRESMQQNLASVIFPSMHSITLVHLTLLNMVSVLLNGTSPTDTMACRHTFIVGDDTMWTTRLTNLLNYFSQQHAKAFVSALHQWRTSKSNPRPHDSVLDFAGWQNVFNFTPGAQELIVGLSTGNWNHGIKTYKSSLSGCSEVLSRTNPLITMQQLRRVVFGFNQKDCAAHSGGKQQRMIHPTKVHTFCSSSSTTGAKCGLHAPYLLHARASTTINTDTKMFFLGQMQTFPGVKIYTPLQILIHETNWRHWHERHDAFVSHLRSGGGGTQKQFERSLFLCRLAEARAFWAEHCNYAAIQRHLSLANVGCRDWDDVKTCFFTGNGMKIFVDGVWCGLLTGSTPISFYEYLCNIRQGHVTMRGMQFIGFNIENADDTGLSYFDIRTYAGQPCFATVPVSCPATPQLWDQRFDVLQANGWVSYLDETEASAHVVLATRPSEVNEYTTHVLLHPALNLSPIPATVALFTHSMGTRNNLLVHQTRHAIGAPGFSLEKRLLPSSRFLVYPQEQTLVYSDVATIFRDLFHTACPALEGMTAIYGDPYTADDAVVVNRGAVERGFGMSTEYRTFYAPEGALMHCPPDIDYLLASGIPAQGTHIPANGIIFATSPPIRLDIECRAVVTIVRYVKDIGTYVQVRTTRNLTSGDKIGSIHAEKVTCVLRDEADMPFLADGTPVTLLLDPRAIFGRMTFGDLLEMLIGWKASHEGTPFNATAFTDYKITEDDIYSCIEDVQSCRSLYNGFTGELVTHDACVGFINWRLLMQKGNKGHCRDTGRVDPVTRQPCEASRGGTAKLGGMEVRRLVMSGAAETVHSLHSGSADGQTLMVCPETFLPSSGFRCQCCVAKQGEETMDGDLLGNVSHGNVLVPVKTTTALVLAMDEMRQLGIDTRFVPSEAEVDTEVGDIDTFPRGVPICEAVRQRQVYYESIPDEEMMDSSDDESGMEETNNEEAVQFTFNLDMDQDQDQDKDKDDLLIVGPYLPRLGDADAPYNPVSDDEADAGYLPRLGDADAPYNPVSDDEADAGYLPWLGDADAPYNPVNDDDGNDNDTFYIE